MTIQVSDVDSVKNEVIVSQSRIIKWLTVGIVLLALFGLGMAWLCVERELVKCDNITTDWQGTGEEYCIIKLEK